MNDLELYVRQDGMYNTLDIVLSNIPVEDVQGWHHFDNVTEESCKNFKEYLWKIRKHFMMLQDIEYIRLIDEDIPDEIIITKKTIEDMNAFRMI